MDEIVPSIEVDVLLRFTRRGWHPDMEPGAKEATGIYQTRDG